MEFFSSCDETQRSHGTLILVGVTYSATMNRCMQPALSIGNAGQLAVDLLISSLCASRVGFVDDPCVVPCVGNDPFGPESEGKLAVALELYGHHENNLSILQQRSPLVKGTTLKFSDNVASWAKDEGFDQIVILSGLDLGRRQTLDYTGPQVYYVSSANEDGADVKCESLGWKKLDAGSNSLAPSGTECIDDFNYLKSLPATALFSAFKSKGLNVVCVFCYCAEGDNIPDAFFLADATDKLLKLSADGITWRVPLSWSTVYGPPPDESMY